MNLTVLAAEERKRQLEVSTEVVKNRDVSSIAFVVMAQNDYIDPVTMMENMELFLDWDEHWTGKAGTIVKENDCLWKSIHDVGPGQNTRPSQTPSMWVKVCDPTVEYPDWEQPKGSHDAYLAGAKVMHKDFRWLNIHGDGNIWEPGIYGWEKVL